MFLTYLVKGIEKGDYTIPFYVTDIEHPYHIANIHVVDHSYHKSKIIRESTCIESGLIEKECEMCGNTVTEEIPIADHIWDWNYTVDRDATCTTEGSESLHCSVCKAIDESTVRAIPKKKHNYSDWVITKAPTCTQEGSKEKDCSVCNDKVTETIPASGHSWNEEYTVDKEATYKEEGSESIHCSICNKIMEGTSRAIPKLRKPISMLTMLGIVDKTYTGEAITQEIVIQDDSKILNYDTDYTIVYSNNTNAGTATVIITGIGDYEGTVNKTFTIDQAPINSAVVTGLSNYTYNGSALVQSPTVRIGNRILAEDTDYTLLYANNTNAGTATLTVTGKGNYTGTVDIDFIISPLSFSKATVTGISSKTYSGSAQTQTPVVKIGSKTLKKGTDYTLSYSNNTNVGIGTVTITGIGNYEGGITSQFKINKAAQVITVKSTASSIPVGKKATVSVTGNKGKVTYTSSNTSVAIVNASTGVVTGKKAGTTTITATSAGTSNYNKASKTVKITVTDSKTLKKPGNCHFAKWNNAKYTSCQIAWNKVEGAEGYQALLSWTDGSHASSTYTKSNVLYRNCTVHPQHVSQMKVRAFYMSNGQRKFGPWSNVEYITPSPTKLTAKNASSGSNLKTNVSWNIIYGCNGYNVFITTNPNGKWYWNQSTSENATANNASIVKCGGSKLKKNTRYYVRIVTRRKRNGVFCTVPMPANNAYTGSFIIQ